MLEPVLLARDLWLEREGDVPVRPGRCGGDAGAALASAPGEIQRREAGHGERLSIEDVEPVDDHRPLVLLAPDRPAEREISEVGGIGRDSW